MQERFNKILHNIMVLHSDNHTEIRLVGGRYLQIFYSGDIEDDRCIGEKRKKNQDDLVCFLNKNLVVI